MSAVVLGGSLEQIQRREAVIRLLHPLGLGDLRGDLPGGFQRVLVEKVTPSLLAARNDGQTEIEDLERRHVREIVNHIVDRSPEIKSRLNDGKVGVVGMRYHLGDGRAEVVVTKGVSENPLI